MYVRIHAQYCSFFFYYLNPYTPDVLIAGQRHLEYSQMWRGKTRRAIWGYSVYTLRPSQGQKIEQTMTGVPDTTFQVLWKSLRWFRGKKLYIIFFTIYAHDGPLWSCDQHHDVDMSRDVRKPVFGVSDQVRHKPGCTATEDGWRLEISDLESRGIVLSKWRKQRRWSASRSPRSWSASLFSHMQNCGFLTSRLI